LGVTASDIGLAEDQRVNRCLDILQEFFPKPDDARQWLNTPHPCFGGMTSLEVIRTKPDALLTLLTNAQNGVPM
jgi:hypothetical protein